MGLLLEPILGLLVSLREEKIAPGKMKNGFLASTLL